MSAVNPHPPLGGEDDSEHSPGGGGGGRLFSRWMAPLEALSALLILGIIGLLLTTVVTRYVLSSAIVWADEVVSMCFIWVTMIGAALAMHALDAHFAAHELRDLLGDGQAQTGASVLARRGGVGLLEALEQFGHLLWCQADAGVSNGASNQDVTFGLLLDLH